MTSPLRAAPQRTVVDSVSEVAEDLRWLKLKNESSAEIERSDSGSSLPRTDAEEFWRQHFDGVKTTALAIPYDKACSQPSNHSTYGEVSLVIPEELCYTVPDAADTTCGVALLAAFHAFLCRIRYSQQDVITVGVQPFHLLMPQASTALAPDRQQALVPVCCPNPEPNDTILAHSKKLHNVLLDVAPYTGTSLQTICSAAGIARACCEEDTAFANCSLQRALFRAAVVWAAAGQAHAAASGLDLALLATPGFKPGNKHVPQVKLLYSKGLFSEHGAAMMANHLQVFLTQAVVSCGTASAAISGGDPWLQPLMLAPLITPADSDLLLSQCFSPRDTELDIPWTDTSGPWVHEIVASYAKARPEAPCMMFEGKTFSYSEVNAASTRVANHLTSQAGVQPGSMVGVLLDRGPLMVVSMLGVLKAGAAFVALDDADKYVQQVMEEAGLQVVITQAELKHRLPGKASLHTLLLHPDKLSTTTAPRSITTSAGSAIAAASLGLAGTELDVGLDKCLEHGDEPACLLYSSNEGTLTSMIVSHKGLATYTAGLRAHFGIMCADVFIQSGPMHLAASIDELWTALSAGAAVVLAPIETQKDPNCLMQLISSQLQQLAKRLLAVYGSSGTGPCASLLRVWCSERPAVLADAELQCVVAAMPKAELHHIFHPTSATLGITSQQLSVASSAAASSVGPVVGKPIHHPQALKLYILDEYQQLVPVGVPGVLHISGAAAPHGSMHPGLASTTFVPNPFCEGPGTNTSMMLNTGCVARWLPTGGDSDLGGIQLLGRLDHKGHLRLETLGTELQVWLEFHRSADIIRLIASRC